MKTIVAAIAAGLLGGGAAIGAISMGFVSVPNTTASTRAPVVVEQAAEDKEDSEALKIEVAQLKSELASLRATQNRGLSEQEIRNLVKAEAERLSTAAPVALKASPDGSASEPVVAAAPAEVQIRDVIAKVEAERVEQRRLDRQAERIRQLTETKESITTNVPTFLNNQQQRLRLDDTQITSLTPALTSYLHQRAENRSEVQSLRIDGKEVDNAAVVEKNRQLEAATLSVLTGIVAQETAESLLRSAQRLGGGGMRGGDGSAPAERQAPQRPRRGGGNNN